jgi:prepilin-type N-terminal cleavage/methylation domain-containing protein
MSKKGFSLIELIITVAIIGILAAIAIPAYVGQQARAARTEAYTNLQNLRLVEEQFMAEQGRYSPCDATTTPPYSSPPPTVTLGTALKDHPGNVAVIQAGGSPADANNALRGFRPGSDLNFSYWIVNGQRITNTSASPITTGVTDNVAGDPPCFVAFAQGNTGTRVANATFAIDCNNNRNF